MSKGLPSRIIWASAAYDFVITFTLATPWTALWLISVLRTLHNALGLWGHPPELSTPLALLFANLLGTLVCVWSVLRMRQPTLNHGVADTITRLMFATWMFYAILQGASGVLIFFITAELLWAVVQGAAVIKIAFLSGPSHAGGLSPEA